MKMRMALMAAALLAAGELRAATQDDYLVFLRGYFQGMSSVDFIDKASLQQASDDGLPEGVVFNSVILGIQQGPGGSVTYWSNFRKHPQKRLVSPNSEALVLASRNSVPADYSVGAGLRIDDMASCAEAGHRVRQGRITEIFTNPVRSLFQVRVDGRELWFSRCWAGETR